MADVELYNGLYTGKKVDDLLTKVDSSEEFTKETQNKYDGYATQIQQLGASMIGEVKPILCSGNYIPEGYVPCDGAFYAYDGIYKDFWKNYLGNGVVANCKMNCCNPSSDYDGYVRIYGQCPLFAIYDEYGPDKKKGFRVPLIKDGSVIQQLNSFISGSQTPYAYNPGLPNITGSVGSWYGQDERNPDICSGAFNNYRLIKSNNAGSGSGWMNAYGADFDASKSSSIYGSSNTVQPQAVAMRYFIRLAYGSYNSSSVDWSGIESELTNIISELSNKANNDLSNINASSSAKETIVGWGIPDYSAGISISLDPYTTPKKGLIQKQLSTGGSSSTIRVNNVQILRQGTAGATDVTYLFFVDKNDIIEGANGGTFYPLKGV